MSTDRRSRVDEPHVFALNALVRAWRAAVDEQRFVPWFDPDGPGVNARILVLMESPAILMAVFLANMIRQAQAGVSVVAGHGGAAAAMAYPDLF